jgi:hypothetical protein
MGVIMSDISQPLELVVIKKYDTDSWNSAPAQFMAVALDEEAAKRWIQDEVDGKHRSDGYQEYALGHDADWWIAYGTFRLSTVQVQE